MRLQDTIPVLMPSDFDDFAGCSRRFWRYVERSENGCWLWARPVKGADYATLHTVLRGKKCPFGVHRFSYLLSHGSLDTSKCVCHTCDVPLCVRPDHLFLGTYSDNMQDMIGKGRGLSGDRSFLHLHPERAARGERHGSRTHPERILCGDEHPLRKHPERAARGDHCPQAKLVARDIPEIMRRRRGGETYTAIARDYGVSSAAIGHIWTGKNWKHIKDS
jgi:hypothetical protein